MIVHDDLFNIKPYEKSKKGLIQRVKDWSKEFYIDIKQYAQKGALSVLITILAATSIIKVFNLPKKQITLPENHPALIAKDKQRFDDLTGIITKEESKSYEENNVSTDFIKKFYDKGNAKEISLLWRTLNEAKENAPSQFKKDFLEFFESYSNNILGIKNSKGKQIFNVESLLSKQTSDGQVVPGFIQLQAIELFANYLKNKTTEKSVDTFLDKNLKDFAEYAGKLGDITGMNGNPIFDNIEAVAFYEQEKTNGEFKLDYLKQIFKKFEDTKKPNAVVVIAKKDWNRAFRQPYIIKEFYEKLAKHCDVYFVVAKGEKDFYETKEKVPEKRFVGLLGHGDGEKIAWGINDPRLFKDSKGEESTIDVSDKEISDYVKQYEKDGKQIESADKDCIFLLLSCSAAKKGIIEKDAANTNIYSFIGYKIDGRIVIGAGKPINLTDFKFDIEKNGKIDPFKIKFIDSNGDYTLRARYNK